MKIIYAMAALLGATVHAAANAVSDLGEGTWWIYKEDWKKYYKLKNGKQIFFEGCDFRIGTKDNARENASGKIKWTTNSSGDRKITVKRNNRKSKSIEFTLDKKGVYWSGGKDGRRWKLWNKSGKVNYSGPIADCAKKTSKFSKSATQWADATDKIASSSSFEKCGQSVQDDCVGTTIEMTEAGWQLATGQLTQAATFLIGATSQAMATEMSFTMKRATNALRCAVVNIGDNAWNVFGMVWYLALEFGYSAEVTKYVDEYYPYVCTCQKETESLSKLFGADDSTASIMGGCSEKVQKIFSEQKEVENGGLPEEDDEE